MSDPYGDGLPDPIDGYQLSDPLTRPTWKIGEEGADAIVHMNCRLLDLLMDRTSRRCSVEGCGWPISIFRDKNFEVPNIGPICTTCHDLYGAIIFTNIKLKNPNYFKNLHDEMVKEIEKKKRGW
jgi:hypothetical protein